MVARARVVHSGSIYTLAEVLMEDALGRAVAHATSSHLVRPMDPSPPSASVSLSPVEEPAYPTPHPFQRPYPSELLGRWDLEGEDGLSLLRKSVTEELPSQPIQDLLGIAFVELDAGNASVSMPATEWLCARSRRVAAGPIACFTHFALNAAVFTLVPAHHRVGIIEQSIGEVRVHGCVRKVRRMITAGRFHIHSATVRFEQGRWWVSVNGVAGEFHHQRRSPKGRHQVPAGIDLGIKYLAVAADADGHELEVWEGVNALRDAQQRLRRANKALARTKPGSRGRAKARARLTRLQTRVAHLRRDLAHRISHWLATSLIRLTVEDLNVAGMARLRTLARVVADAGLGDLLRQVAYKAAWYGCELHVADRWYPSSKTCSACGHVKDRLLLSERTYHCDACGHRADRDHNAAVNLARWPDQPCTSASPPLACPTGHPGAA